VAKPLCARRIRLGEYERLAGYVPEMIENSSPSPGEHRVVKAYLFDKRRGEIVEDWAGSLQHLSKSQVLWLDLQDPSQEQAAEVLDALDLADVGELQLDDPEKTPAVEQHESHWRVTAIAVSDAEQDPDRERIVVDCFLGSNWVLTAHTADIAALDDFRTVAEGQGEIGLLDAPSFSRRFWNGS
jgi:Mg2+ and Co2+ transporter CorA